MKINIPKVIAQIEMSEYAAELAGKYLMVWVNPPLDVLNHYTELLETETKNSQPLLSDELMSWYLIIWSQGVPETRWALGELREIEKDDPAFLRWMILSIGEARKDHMALKKKV